MNMIIAKNKILFPERVGKEYVLVAGGRRPAAGWLKKIAAGRVVVCADRGVSWCRAAGVHPDILLGDGDSAGADWAWAERAGAMTRRYPRDKDATDLQLAIDFIKEAGDCCALVATGVWGGRFDHAFSALFSLAALRCPLLLADHRELLAPVYAEKTLSITFSQTPPVLSLLPLSESCRVTLTGTDWPLEAVKLFLERPYAISNRVSGRQINLSVQEGRVGLYLCWKSDWQ